MSKGPALVVHGGCGDVPPEEEAPRTAACERAADAGFAILPKGGSAVRTAAPACGPVQPKGHDDRSDAEQGEEGDLRAGTRHDDGKANPGTREPTRS